MSGVMLPELGEFEHWLVTPGGRKRHIGRMHPNGMWYLLCRGSEPLPADEAEEPAMLTQMCRRCRRICS